METNKQKLKMQESMLSDEFLNLRVLNTNVILEKLEHDIKLREMPIEKRLKLRV